MCRVLLFLFLFFLFSFLPSSPFLISLLLCVPAFDAIESSLLPFLDDYVPSMDDKFSRFWQRVDKFLGLPIRALKKGFIRSIRRPRFAFLVPLENAAPRLGWVWFVNKLWMKNYYICLN